MIRKRPNNNRLQPTIADPPTALSNICYTNAESVLLISQAVWMHPLQGPLVCEYSHWPDARLGGSCKSPADDSISLMKQKLIDQD